MIERKWWTLIAVCVATFMLLIDVTVVNVALPDIQRDLNTDLTGLQWIVDAYALVLAALLLTAGTLADRYGRRLVFLVGLAVFTLSSLACGLAPSDTFLHFARGAQGAGGAAMLATSLALIAGEFEGRERGTAIAAWGATIGGAVAIGPLVGGALTEGLGWEWVFFVNVPVGIAAFAIAAARANESRDPDARRVDLSGLATFSGALFALNFGLLRGNAEGWTSTLILVSLIGGAALLGAFVVVERGQQRPMFDLSLFSKPTFVGVSLGTFAIGAGMFAMFLYLTIYIQSVLGYSPLQAGLRFLPQTVLAFLVPALTRNLVEKIPARVPLSVGLTLVGVGLVLMGGIEPGDSWTHLLPGFILSGFGVGLFNPSAARTALGVVSAARSGMASGINSTFRLGGVATGVAGLGALFQNRIDSELAKLLPSAPSGFSDAVAASGTSAAEMAPAPIRAQVAEASREAFITALNEILVVAAVMVLLGALLSFLTIRAKDFVAPPGVVPPSAR